MESNAAASAPRTPGEAQASLAMVDGVRAGLADRMVTPWWYHPGLGLFEGLLVAAMAFPLQFQLMAGAIALVAFFGLASAWSRVTGLGISREYTTMAVGWLVALALILLVAFAVAHLVGGTTVTLLAAAVTFAATVVVGRRADARVRDRLRQSAGAW